MSIESILRGLPDTVQRPIPDHEESFETGPLRDRLEELINARQQQLRTEAIGSFDWDGMEPSKDAEDVRRMIVAEAEAVYGAAANMVEFFIMALAIGAELEAETLRLATSGVSEENGWRESATGGAKRIAAGFTNSRKRFDDQAAHVIARLEAEGA